MISYYITLCYAISYCIIFREQMDGEANDMGARVQAGSHSSLERPKTMSLVGPTPTDQFPLWLQVSVSVVRPTLDH